MIGIRTVEWADGKIRMIDQTLLPNEEKFLTIDNIEDLAEAICSLRVRGAPAIGVAAALGVAMAAHNYQGADITELKEHLDKACKKLSETRPTAVNLFWAISKMNETIQNAVKEPDIDRAKSHIIEKAVDIANRDEEINRSIGKNGSALIKDGDTIITHCNAGSLATSYYGTALGVIRAAHEKGKKIAVIADETRPLLQGARLTSWEMKKMGIPVTLITDNMAAHVISKGMVDLAIVGADRIASNGDVANKIGTYGLALASKTHGIPFYVAAPISTIDMSLKSGADIPIEQRDPREVTHIHANRLAPEDIDVYNPAFDVTPNEYVTAIITEKGIAKKPYETSLKEMTI